MGGNALKHMQPVRLRSHEMVLLFQHLARNWALFHAYPLSLVPWVAEKDDHGDMDIICPATPEVVYQMVSGLGILSSSVVRNHLVLSVPVPLPWAPTAIAQVDFICCSPQEQQALCLFYSGGDFGMYLGRIAAWHGLVYGMDGLRYRADPEQNWAQDVLLTDQPATILRLLGYPPTIPWFDTYDHVWRYVLSSPLAGAWMFLPEATNNENRSRDRQRRKIVDFQEWLHLHYADDLTPRFARSTPAQAQAWVERNFPDLDIKIIIDQQRQTYLDHKERRHRLGLGAVEAVIGSGYSREMMGEIVRAMQSLLPPIDERERAWTDPEQAKQVEAQAHTAARSVAMARGIPCIQREG